MFHIGSTEKFYSSFKGIKRQDYSKWEGWKVIDDYKEKGVHVSLINDEHLDIMYENFILLISLKEILIKSYTF